MLCCIQTCLSFLVYNWDGENVDESTFLGAAHIVLTMVCLRAVLHGQQLCHSIEDSYSMLT